MLTPHAKHGCGQGVTHATHQFSASCVSSRTMALERWSRLQLRKRARGHQTQIMHAARGAVTWEGALGGHAVTPGGQRGSARHRLQSKPRAGRRPARQALKPRARANSTLCKRLGSQMPPSRAVPWQKATTRRHPKCGGNAGTAAELQRGAARTRHRETSPGTCHRRKWTSTEHQRCRR